MLGRIIEKSALWGNTVFRVWLPSSDSIVRVDGSALSPAQSSVLSTHHLTYLAAAARVADALTQDVLLAPIESSVIPLPHQIRALSRAISNDRVRYLLADEVGLGKTIEAGLIMRELKLRGLVRRTLVIAPKGLVTQWIAEMATHFNEQFHPIMSDDYRSLKRISAIHGTEERGLRTEFLENWALGPQSSSLRAANPNPFRAFDQVIVSMDSVKPPSDGRGAAWERFEDLISAGWDLVIVDEAHRLGGSTDQVARYKLGQGLAEAASYLLLLSATPHQGKTDAFHRLISLVDAQAFPDVSSVTKERVQPYVIRTEKRRAIDAEGKPLFKPRRTELAPVSWEDRHRDQRLLYEAVTEYVREGFNQAMREKRSYIGFLMILMQRLVVSSTRAIRTALERRLEALEAPQEQLTLFPQLSEEDWADLDGQEQMDALLGTRPALTNLQDSKFGRAEGTPEGCEPGMASINNERAEVKQLLEAARRCETQGPDAKAEALLDWIYRLQAEEGDPDLKVLVFTEFVPTQEMLYEFLTERGFEVVCLNGSMDMEERKRVQDAFAKDARILISTDAGGEGLNLQFCHVVINYDIPWNPMRLEQRIGRVDRIGQTHTVRAINFVFEDSVEHRVREVLEEKLAVIFEEFGIDKTGDVLDSAQAGQIFDDLYVEAILNPDVVETKVDEVLKNIQEQARESRQSASVLGSTEDLDPREAQRLLAHPLPHWVERMTVSYLQAHGGKAERKNGAWDLTWPNGERLTNVVFTSKEAEEKPLSRHLTLEDPKVRGLAMRLPPFAPGQPVPVITLPGLAPEIMGFWSLWRISISTADWNRRRIMPLFLADDGRVFAPTARHIWDQLLVTKPTILRHLDIETSHQAFERLREAAERQGKTIYDELVQAHRERLAREREKGEYAFAARRRAIERIGLPQVRNHRLSLLEQEEERFREQLERRAQILPEMAPLLLVRVEGGAHG
jgi:superfamily II DNA or RNA helicase